MKIEFKIGRKKFSFTPTKRNVKIWQTASEAVMKEWNLDEREPMISVSDRKLIYFAEFWNGVIEHVNNVKAKIVQD